MEPNHNLRRAAMPFSRPTSFERHARNFESFQKPRTSLLILFLYASLERNEGRHEGAMASTNIKEVQTGCGVLGALFREQKDPKGERVVRSFCEGLA